MRPEWWLVTPSPLTHVLSNGWLPGIAPLDELSSNIIIFGRLFNLLEVSSLDVLNEVMVL